MSMQGPAHNQMHVAHALGIPAHKVVGKTKRLGGGFGGKETRAVNVSCAAAVPAYRLRRPVRLILDRDEDMHTSRPPPRLHWQVQGQGLTTGRLLGPVSFCGLQMVECMVTCAPPVTGPPTLTIVSQSVPRCF